MSKSYKATKRDIREYCDTHEFDEHYCPGADLSRHPNSKKKRTSTTGRMPTYGSDKHINRKSNRKAKQEWHQRIRNFRKTEAYKIIQDIINEEEIY